MWFSLLALAAGGTWLAWRSLRQGLKPLEMFIASTTGTLSERARANLMPLSLDELGVLTARYAEMLSSRQQLTDELQRSQLLADSVIDSAGVLVLVLDRDGRIVRFNRACETLTGLTFAEVSGKYPWDTLLPPEDAETVRKNAFEALAHNPQAMSGRYTNHWMTRQGERALIDFTNTVLLDPQGHMEYMISVGSDITERERNARLLAQSEARLNEAQRMAKVGSWELDLENNHLHWSDEIFNIFEIEKRLFAASYEAFLNGIHPDDRDRVNQAYSASLIDRSPYEIVHRLMMGDGRIKYVRETCESYFAADGKPLRSVGTVQDISELHQAEEKLRQHRDRLEEVVQERTAEMKRARDEAERSSTAKSEFLSRMSHELRTPLNAILGFAQLLQMEQKPALNDMQSNNVEEIMTGGKQLLALINEVLDLSKIENGQLAVVHEAVEVAPLINACLTQLSPLASEKKITFFFEDQHKSHTVSGDAVRLREVLDNLLSNAVKYNRTGGEIHIGCALAPTQRLRISIRDTGRGIAADSLSRLFKPFERMESPYDGIEGSGIGLALSKRLVEAMNGVIGVESEAGTGSTFWFELPLSNNHITAGLKPPSHALNASNRRTLLYIEDNIANMRLMKK